MAQPIVTFEGQEGNFINQNQLNLTLKLRPLEFRTYSYLDVLNVLEAEGVKPEELLGLYKVSSADPSFSVFLSNEEVLNRLKEKQRLSNGKINLSVTSMAEQIVTVRVHWLPLYYDNRLLKAIFCDYGEVLDVRMCKSSHEKLVAMNGMREVTIKTDEVLKQKIPHLINFRSGQSILLTMQGRPPLCLRCKCVGHVRKDCEQRLYAQSVQRGPSSRGPSEPVRPDPSEGTSAGPAGPTDVPPSPVSGADGSGDDLARSGDEEMGEDSDSNNDVTLEEKGSKRGLGEDDDDDYITPNKTAKCKTLPPAEPVPLTNPYDPILTVNDLMSDA